jgi:hypothetical protein
MSKIQLSDVIDKLYDQFDMITNQSTTGEPLKEQMDRTKAVVSIAKQITETARLGLDAQKIRDDLREDTQLPNMLKLTTD